MCICNIHIELLISYFPVTCYLKRFLSLQVQFDIKFELYKFGIYFQLANIHHITSSIIGNEAMSSVFFINEPHINKVLHLSERPCTNLSRYTLGQFRMGNVITSPGDEDEDIKKYLKETKEKFEDKWDLQAKNEKLVGYFDVTEHQLLK